MEIKAKLIEKYETATLGTGGFRKRVFVVEYAENPEYPEFIKFELIQDKCDELDKFELGAIIDIAFNLKGRKWTNPKGEVVYFNSLQAWKLSASVQTHDITSEHETNQGDAVMPDWMKDQAQEKGVKPDSDLPF